MACVDALGALRRWWWPHVGLCGYRHRFLWPILSGVHHDGHNRGEGGHRPLAAPDRAVAGGAWVVPVRPDRPPRAHGAQRDRTAGGPGIVSRSRTRFPGPAALAQPHRLRIIPWTVGRRARLARLRAAPPAAAARSFD